jgi:hypothetical protein
MRDGEELWRGEVTSELRHLRNNVAGVQRQLYELTSMMAQELAAHRDYHKQNEHRWGFARWCQLHPFLLVMIAAAGVGVAAAGTNLPAMAAVVRIFADLLR